MKVGTVQLDILRHLWEHGESTARQISAGVESQHGLSHSTVQTLLRKLEKKGAIKHREENGVFYFQANSEKDEVTSSATHEFLSKVFEGSVSRLVSHLIDQKQITKEELDRLTKLIKEREDKNS